MGVKRPFGWFLVIAIMVFSTTPAMIAGEWSELVAGARGQTVDWYMYGGFPHANEYVKGYLAPRLKAQYDITLRQVPVSDISEVVGKLLVEKQAGHDQGGKADLLWINGENFRTAKQHGLLHGPFTHQLPHRQYVNWQRPSVANDFGEPVEGLESPWGSAQVVMIHDAVRTPDPPRSMGDLIRWIRANPGRFTYPAPPDFTGSVFVRHVFYHVSGEVTGWQKGFDEGRFMHAAAQTYKLLKDLTPYLWRQGKTYPESPTRMNNLFADGEIDFSFSYHPAEASKNIADGLYPKTVRTFVFREGTIANTHFVAIPFNAADKAGAMVVANFLLSPEAQLKKADPMVWGDLPAIDTDRLDDGWRVKFEQLPRGVATLGHDVLQRHQLPEPPSQILIRLEKGWRENVLRGR